MGGDHGPGVVVPAAYEAVAEIRNNVPERISERIASVLIEKEAV